MQFIDKDERVVHNQHTSRSVEELHHAQIDGWVSASVVRRYVGENVQFAASRTPHAVQG